MGPLDHAVLLVYLLAILVRPDPKSLSERGSGFKVLGSGLPPDVTSARLEHFRDVELRFCGNSPLFETPRPYS